MTPDVDLWRLTFVRPGASQSLIFLQSLKRSLIPGKDKRGKGMLKGRNK